MSDERKQFEQLLPFYLNGSLDNEEKIFVEQYLRLNPQANQSLVFTKNLQHTVRTLSSDKAPEAQRIQQLKIRFHEAREKTAPKKSVKRTQWLKGLLLGLPGLGLAVALASVIFIASSMHFGLFSIDGLDGQPDLELTLASGVTPDHEVVVALLKKYHSVILSRSETDGYHKVLVDLENPAKQQYPFIETLQASGHLKDFKLLASR